MNFKLHDYQRQFCRGVTDAFERGVDGQQFKRLLGCAGTGAGKTIMASALAWYRVKKKDQRVLFLADRDELVSQAAAKFHAAAGLFASIEKASDRASLQAPVVVGSVQSMQGKRLKRFPADHFGLVIADEAHLSLAPQWQRVLKRFTADELGLTATPERGDKQSLMGFWQHVAAEIPMALLIERRQLSPIVVQTVPLELPVNIEAAEAAEDEENAALLAPFYGQIIDAIEAHAADRKALLFFHPSRKSSQDFTTELLLRGHAAAHVAGDSKDRKEVLEGFHRGRFRILNNSQLLTTGYDEQRIDCVCVLRVCRSRTQYVQMIGRGARLYCPQGCAVWCNHPDRKQDCLVLDFLWQFEGHDIMGPADLFTDAPEMREASKKAAKSGERVDLLGFNVEYQREKELQILRRIKAIQGKTAPGKVSALALGAMLRQAELIEYVPHAIWQGKEPTPGQLSALSAWGVDPLSVTCRGHASKILHTLIANKQAGRPDAVRAIHNLAA